MDYQYSFYIETFIGSILFIHKKDSFVVEQQKLYYVLLYSMYFVFVLRNSSFDRLNSTFRPTSPDRGSLTVLFLGVTSIRVNLN